MRIRFLVPRCTPDNSHGRYVIELASRLAAAHEVTVHAGRFSQPLPSLVRCHHLPVPNRPALARLAALWTSSSLLNRSDVDVVHVQGADAPVGNVITAHCCNAAMRAAAGPPATIRRKINYAIGAAAEKHCFGRKAVRRVIAVSQKVRGEIEREYRIQPTKIVVVPHGVDGESFHPRNRPLERERVRRHLGLTSDDFVVLFVGGDYRVKGLIPLLSAVGNFGQRLKILAAGVSEDSLLRGIVQRQHLGARIRLLGVRKDMPLLYAAADCFTLPTNYDTFSLATLEAMASGLPIIVSRDAGVAELLDPGRDSLVLDDAGDVDALTAALQRLVRDETLRERLGWEARKTAERYTWEEVARRTVEVYAEALGRGSA